MKNNNKKIVALLLIVLVLALGGAAVYVSTLLQQAPTPTTPTSRPRAAEFVGGGSCNVSFIVDAPGLTCAKTVNDTNTSQTEITTVSQNKEIIYKIKTTNTGSTDLTNVKVEDTLNGENQSYLVYVSASEGCVFDSGSRKITCTIASLARDETKEVFIRVKVPQEAANGQVIKNTANVIVGDLSATCNKDVTVSGVVSCNNTCNTDTQCSNGLKCISGNCRNESCSGEQDCTCPTGTVTTTTTVTQRPTGTATTTTTTTATATVTQEQLPEAGILNLPGAAAFGAGLLLTVLGILFAL